VVLELVQHIASLVAAVAVFVSHIKVKRIHLVFKPSGMPESFCRPKVCSEKIPSFYPSVSGRSGCGWRP
jgi:hypothetical protein